MSPGKQLQVYNEKGEIAPDSLIKYIVDFESKVNEMRQLQKKYFDTRDKSILAKSKAIEKEVDRMLSEMGYDSQKKIF